MPQLIIIIASGVIIVILARNLPKVKDDVAGSFWSGNYDEVEAREKEKFRYLYDRFLKKLKKEEFKKRMDIFWIWLEKILRKVRINFLKIDNRIVTVLEKLREKNLAKIENIFKESRHKKGGSVPGAGDGLADSIITPEEVKKFDWKKINKDALSERSAKADAEPQVRVLDEIKTVRKEPENVITKPDIDIAAKIETEENDKVADADEIVENLGDENRTDKEKEYIEMIMKNPIDIKAYWHLGTIYARRRNYKDAIECFRQITKIDPTYEKAKHKLSEILAKMKKGVKRGKKGIDESDEEVENDYNNLPT